MRKFIFAFIVRETTPNQIHFDCGFATVWVCSRTLWQNRNRFGRFSWEKHATYILFNVCTKKTKQWMDHHYRCRHYRRQFWIAYVGESSTRAFVTSFIFFSHLSCCCCLPLFHMKISFEYFSFDFIYFVSLHVHMFKIVIRLSSSCFFNSIVYFWFCCMQNLNRFSCAFIWLIRLFLTKHETNATKCLRSISSHETILVSFYSLLFSSSSLSRLAIAHT